MSTFTTLVEGALYGLSLGMLYVLVALGLTLIFGLMDVINFAHGAMVTLGAYIGIVTVSATGNFWIALVAAGLLVGVLGVGIERTTVRRLYDFSPIYQLLLTFGIALIIEGAIILRYGFDNRRLAGPELVAGSPVSIGPAILPRYRVFIIVFTTVLVGLLWFLIQRSKLGLIIKAGIEDRERTQLLGIRLSRINMLIFGVGAGLAAMAGVLAAPLFGVNPQFGTRFLIVSFVIIVVGGLGNIRGTIVAGLLIGVLYSITIFFYQAAADPIIYVAMILVLLIRPEGLFGGNTA